MINICIRRNKPEIEYICHVIFNTFLGLDYQITEQSEISTMLLHLDNNTSIELPDYFDELLTVSSVTEIIDFSTSTNPYIPEDNVPVIFGDGSCIKMSSKIKLNVDIFATCFLMLSRIEEIKEDVVLDEHGRFPATSSIAYKYGFLERPIVDEYVEMLWNMIIDLDPSQERKALVHRKLVTCDVDWPFEQSSESLFLTAKTALIDLLRRKSIKQCLRRWQKFFQNKFCSTYSDFNSDMIYWIMEKNESRGNKAAFYFITESTNKNLDSSFDFDSKRMRNLIKDISARGHEIGLHPGYGCYQNSSAFKKSSDTLKRVLNEEGIKQKQLGGRMHFLMWDSKITPALWEQNGFTYDSTLAFADKSGFRCGTCRTYPMYDLVQRKQLNLLQRPLINMECTVIAQRYEGLGYSSKALERFMKFKSIAEKYNGEYVLLWHNTHFKTSNDKKFYEELI